MNTHEEEIRQIAYKLADTNVGPYNEGDYTDHSGHNAYRCAYEEGAFDALKWADAHPKNPWRDAKTAPPKDNNAVYVSDRGIKTVAYYYPDSKVWFENGLGLMHNVDYWMPMPELPKGGEV